MAEVENDKPQFKPGDILMSENYDHVQWLVMDSYDAMSPMPIGNFVWARIIRHLLDEPHNAGPEWWDITRYSLVCVDSAREQEIRATHRTMRETHDYYSQLTELAMGEQA